MCTALQVHTVWCHDQETICLQGHRKQSADGQAQLNVGGKVVNNLCAKHMAKFWSYLSLGVRRRSHCTSASNWELPLLCSPALQGTSSLIKSWENTYDFLQHPFLHHIAMSYTMHVGWKDLRAIFFWPNVFFWKENNTSWWGSPGRSAGKFSHTECRSYAIALT